MRIRGFILPVLILLVAGCGNADNNGFITVTVNKVEQVQGYTYLLVKAKGPAYWLAVPSMEVNEGDRYHYTGGMVMKDFYSKELDRTFKEVLFLEVIFPGKPGAAQAGMAGTVHPGQEMTPGSTIAVEKSDVVVEAVEGTVRIGELYADPSAYEGKVIRVRGEVTKFNPAIMERNWIHLQDGTSFKGKFDLTVTSVESFETGSVVTMEGTVALNRDFGYGYSYEILLEKATAVKKP